MSDDHFADGMKVRRAVLGDAHVDRAEAGKSDFDTDFQRYITDSAWGQVWTRPGLDRRERSMLTMVILAALGHHEEFAMHVRASHGNGASADDIKESLFHVAVYAGVPAANRAYAIAKPILAELDMAPPGESA